MPREIGSGSERWRVVERAWDTSHFGFPVGDLTADPDGRPLAEVTEGFGLVIARVAADRMGTVQSLEQAGFFLCENTVTFTATAEDLLSAVTVGGAASFGSLDFATPADQAAIYSIAAAAFETGSTQWHSDPSIDDRLVTELYAKWGRNSVVDRRLATTVVVLRSEGSVGGFAAVSATCRGKPVDRLALADEAVVRLNATNPLRYRRGVYRALLAEIARNVPPNCEVSLGTQAANHAVIATWARVKCASIRFDCVLHRIDHGR
jgi:hypothetical protein